MNSKKEHIYLKIHLAISVCIVVPAAIVYGFFPDTLLELFPKTIDEYNFNKAIMGLYLAFASVWILGILRTRYLKAALLSNMVFMLGLGFGRVLSIIVDGMPSNLYLIGTLGEIFLGFYGFWVLKRLKNQQ